MSKGADSAPPALLGLRPLLHVTGLVLRVSEFRFTPCIPSPLSLGGGYFFADRINGLKKKNKTSIARLQGKSGWVSEFLLHW